jgi:hypothetical protein
VTHWSSWLLARHLKSGDSTVARAWREYGVRPWLAGLRKAGFQADYRELKGTSHEEMVDPDATPEVYGRRLGHGLPARRGLRCADREVPAGLGRLACCGVRSGDSTHRLSLQPGLLSEVADWMDRKHACGRACSTSSSST